MHVPSKFKRPFSPLEQDITSNSSPNAKAALGDTVTKLRKQNSTLSFFLPLKILTLSFYVKLGLNLTIDSHSTASLSYARTDLRAKAVALRFAFATPPLSNP